MALSQLAAELVHAIDGDRPAMQDLLARLVAIPTENPPGTGYAECLELLESTLDHLEFSHERLVIPSPTAAPRAALRAWSGSPGPTLYFHGHFDVVPAMSRDQFVPRIEGDTLFGRGSSDMKSGLVSMLYAARAVMRAGAPL
jgi:acetylornithine deacetylase/succinyl-diaminopimelate desuccinylase-like protein